MIIADSDTILSDAENPELARGDASADLAPVPNTVSIGSGKRAGVAPGGQLTAAEQERLVTLAAHAVSPATRRAYQSDWRRWEAWCHRRYAVVLPADPSLVALYLEEHASMLSNDGGYAFSPSTLSRWIASLNQICRAAGDVAPGENPKVRTTLSAIRRTRAQPPRRREPLLLGDLTVITAQIRASAGRLRAGRIAARRDIAIMMAGFFGGFRRSELSALRLTDVAYDRDDGLHVWVRQSKTDQEAQGQVKALPFTDDPGTCPVCAVLQWLQLVQAWDQRGRSGVMKVLRNPDLSPGEGHVCTPDHPALTGHTLAGHQNNGMLLRGVHRSGSLREGGLSGHAINTLVQRRAKDAGIPSERVARMGGHSLRAGLVTEAYRAGATAEEIARQTGHRSLSVLAGYRREHAPLQGNAVTRLAHQITTAGTTASSTGADTATGIAHPAESGPGLGYSVAESDHTKQAARS